MDTGLRSGLVEVRADLPTFASAGLERRAEEIGRIAASSVEYLADLLEHRPEVQVLVLSEADWADKGRVPLYGLPNANEGTLVVAGTEAPFWSDLAHMAGETGQAEMAATYAGPDGVIRFGGFFDLVAVHEVAHLFTEGVVRFPRLWLGELFANLCLHAWVERRAPASLPTLLTLPRRGAQAPASAFEHRTRDAFEQFYASIAGPNYVWYQFRLQMAAADLYRTAGEVSVRRLFDAFRLEDGASAVSLGEAHDPSVDDQTLAARLSEAVDPELGAFSLAF
jgi:hypothetical protein